MEFSLAYRRSLGYSQLGMLIAMTSYLYFSQDLTAAHLKLGSLCTCQSRSITLVSWEPIDQKIPIMTDPNTALMDLVERSGALQTGHFQLASGLHASRFFRCIKLFQDPQAAEVIFTELADRFRGESIDRVLGANEAGSILAFEVAKCLGVQIAIARQHQQIYGLIDGFELEPGSRILVVDDITTTGGTAKQLLRIVREAGAIPIGVGLVATKGIFAVDLGCRTEVLLSLQGMDAVDPRWCVGCQQGMPLSR